MGLFNGTCPIPNSVITQPNSEEPLVGNVTFQHLLFYIAGGFTILATILSVLLTISHLACYVRPREQRQIIRIIFYPVVFSILSCFSILEYPASLYLVPLTSIYEPVALVGIFFLFVEYAHDEPSTREQYFQNLQHQRKAGGGRFGGGQWQNEEGGSLRWFHAKYVALFVYFVASILIEVVELITQAIGRYCEYTYSLAYAHVYIVIISDVALGVGVLAVLQFYARMKKEPHFKAHRPTAKLISFKGVILVMFLQETVFGILTGHQVWKAHPRVTIRDQHIGIQQALVCMEMMLVTLAFHFTFRDTEYRQIKRTSGARSMNIFRAACNALNPTDIFAEAGRAIFLIRSGTGPIGNGSWQKTGGYQIVQDSQGRTGRNRRVGLVGQSNKPSSISPPAYDDSRPLRGPSPYRPLHSYRNNDAAFTGQNHALEQQQQQLPLQLPAQYQLHPYRPYSG